MGGGGAGGVPEIWGGGEAREVERVPEDHLLCIVGRWVWTLEDGK